MKVKIIYNKNDATFSRFIEDENEYLEQWKDKIFVFNLAGREIEYVSKDDI